MPKIVRASPVATWLELSVMVKNPKSRAPASAPRSPPRRLPSAGIAGHTVPAKPPMAPSSIMPSTPRLRTPPFSATSSPEAGKQDRRRRCRRW